VVIDELLETVPLPKCDELRLTVEESLSDNLRSMRLSRLSSGHLSLNDRRRSVDTIVVDFLEPIESNTKAATSC